MFRPAGFGHLLVMNIAVLTSGGDSPGMNAGIRAIVRHGISQGHQIFGFVEGFRGLVDKEKLELDRASVSEIIDRGGTILRTSRYDEFLRPEIQKQAARNLQSAGIDALIVIGGEGSMRGTDALGKNGASVIGVPASIDNDIYGTDFSIGFDSALNTVVAMLSKLRDTASSHERIFVVEVMGRRSGSIALNAGVAGGADYTCLPGTPAIAPEQVKEMTAIVNSRYRRGKTHTLIVVAEGAGSAAEVAAAIHAGTDQEVRISVLGHIQRGGSPSAMDRLLASRLGAHAVDLAAAGKSGLMVGLVGGRLTATELPAAFGQKAALDADLYRLAKEVA
jgi:6-phosphofructokinase 1